MSVTNDEKSALTDLNQRFLCYVNKVRRLKDEDDIRIINENVSMLEDELRALKGSYETQISQLGTTLDIVVAQKVDMERELAARKSNEMQLSDRVAVESARTTRLLHELSGLQSEVSVRDQEAISLTLTVQQLRLETGEGQNQRARLQRELQQIQTKNSQYEERIRDYENSISSLTEKIEFQDHFFSKKLGELKDKLEERLDKMVELDYQVEEARQRDCQWPLILDNANKTADAAYDKLKTETQTCFSERVTLVQRQLESEVSENGRLKSVNDELSNKLLQMRKTDAELRSKVEQLQRQSDILEQTLKKDKQDAGRTIMSLQNKIKELQDNFIQELEDVKIGRGNEGVQIRGEIEFLKRLLSEEERRLHICPTDRQGEDSRASGQHYNENAEDVSEVDIEEDRGSRYMNNTSAEELLHYETEVGRRSDLCNGLGNGQINGYRTEEMNASGDINIEEHERQWSGGKEGDAFIHVSGLVGPIYHAAAAVGPVAQSTPAPHPPYERPPRPASANVRGIRSKMITSQPECPPNKDCSSSSSTQRADSGLGQSPDYFDSVFKNKAREPSTADKEDYCINLTHVRVMEVNKDGKYIRICNTHETQDVEIGKYMIKQNRFSHPVAIFRFPERVKLQANSAVTVWSGSNDPLVHQPPTDFYSEEPTAWGSGPEYATILCNSLGQAVSWTTQPHRIHADPYRAKTAPTIRKETKRDKMEKLPELISNSNATPNDHIYLLSRDNNGELPMHQQVTSTPKSSIKPCMESSRVRATTKDNDCFNRQARQYDAHPEVQVGQPYIGKNGQRLVGSACVSRFYPGCLQSSHSINNRTPDVIFRSTTEPPSTFQKPMSRFMTGLDQVQSMHNQFFNPPMYKTEANATAH